MDGFETREIHKKGLELIENGESLFITGKAGTGKTMFLKYLIKKLGHKKRIVTLSPTGVAARNACGFTIHSFLKLPLGPYIPNHKKYGLYKLDILKDVPLIKELDIMIIDEISMVRCDLLDEVDDVLRHYRGNDKPFGGVQLVLFGDLYQLMPVAKDEEAEELRKHYDTLNFYSSYAFQELDCKLLELRKVYRQKDNEFVNVLNDLRVGQNKNKVLKRLSLRYNKLFNPSDKEGYIRLTTHNWRAKKYNNEKLDNIYGEEHEFKAYIEDYFPKHEFPTDYVLRLKVGCRVMFVRNDNKYHQFVNGTLGTITRISGYEIVVKVDDTGQLVNVERQQWDFYRYRINKQTKEIYQELIGSFTQYPLKLAWAITIHKSQGLTFDRVIIDAGKAFADGQVYVALSRCTDLQGVVLVSEITPDNIKVSHEVVDYLNSATRVEVFDEEVEEDERKQDEERDKVRKLPHGAIEKTYWMANDGLSIPQMVTKSGERIEIIYSHISKLVEGGYVDVHDYIADAKYNEIRRVIKKYGVNTHLKTIKDTCREDVKIGQVTMVIASIKHGDPENYTHKVKERMIRKPTKLDFSDDIPTVTRGNGSRKGDVDSLSTNVRRKISLTRVSKEDATSIKKRNTIFISSSDSKSKDVDQRIRELRILDAADKAMGRVKPKVIVSYRAMSNPIGNSGCRVVSARDGYYVQQNNGRYCFLTAQLKEDASGSIYTKSDKADKNRFTLFHSGFDNVDVKIGTLILNGQFYTFIDNEGNQHTARFT